MSDTLQDDLLAQERHSGKAWVVIILLALLAPAMAMAFSRAPLWPLAIITVAALGVSAIAWSGFQYRFLRHGVEVRMLGFRVRSIPKQSIQSYSIEPWTFIHGYGIRGLGKTRAYVWGNKVVHIRTSNGDTFLGHRDPQRIVHDLDLVMGSK